MKFKAGDVVFRNIPSGLDIMKITLVEHAKYTAEQVNQCGDWIPGAKWTFPMKGFEEDYQLLNEEGKAQYV